jgi:hypothetical protein
MSSRPGTSRPQRVSVRLFLLFLTCLIALGVTSEPAWAQAVDCVADGLRGWQVITNASGGTPEQALCNFKVTRTVEGKQFVSGTAITIETYCTPTEGAEAFEGKTGPRGATETERVEGERLVIEEGQFAQDASGRPNPDNAHRDGVFSQFFPEINFRLFEKEWLQLNPQIVATIVVLTSERGLVKEENRYGVDDAEPVAASMAKRVARVRSDCKIPGTIDVPVGAKSPQAKGGGGGGGGVPLAPVLVAAGAGGTLVTVARRRRRRKFTPPRTYPGGRSNPWDPDVDTQRRRWDKEKLVWDPNTLSWRDPVDSDFEDLPEVPTPIEGQIPEDKVPSACLDIYTKYIREQAAVRDIKITIDEAQRKLSISTTRYRKNSIRAKAQLGVDIGGAILQIGSSAFAAAKAAQAARGAVGTSNPALALGHEARTRAAKRLADLEGEAATVRSRLAKSQLELESSGLNPGRIKNALDDAAGEISTLRKRLGQLDDGIETLKKQRGAIRNERQELGAKQTALDEEIAAMEKSNDFRLGKEKEWKTTESSKDKTRRLDELKADEAQVADLHTYEAELAQAVNDKQMTRAQADTLLDEAWKGRGKKRMDMDDFAKRAEAIHAEEAADFEKWLQSQPGYDPSWTPNRGRPVRRVEIDKEKAAIKERMTKLEREDNRLGLEIAVETDAAEKQAAKLRQELTGANERHEAALAQQKQFDALDQKMRQDGGELDAIKTKAADVTEQRKQIDEALDGIASGKAPGMLPAAMLGAMLAWLSPAAAAIALAGILAGKTYEALGIATQSPQEIWQILTENAQEIRTLEQTITEQIPKYEESLKRLPSISADLKNCIATNSPATVP